MTNITVSPSPNSVAGIAELLLGCEHSGGRAHAYIRAAETKTPVPVATEGRDIFVVSDLHLASGRGVDGRYDGCENFFFDASFHRFLRQINQSAGTNKAILIINGDFVDFLRVTYVPGRERGLSKMQKLIKRLKLRTRKRRIRSLTPDKRREFEKDFEEWRQILERVGITRSLEDLINSVSSKEETYGLKTDDYKSVLRMHVVLRGHEQFFEALAEWLGSGHRIIIVKGNHDLEWYWQAVRNYLRLDLALRLGRNGVGETLEKIVLPNLTFIDHAMLIDGDFYIEHGHQFDPLTRVLGVETVNDGAELNIPFGSFINRYLLNFIEKQYSFIDNIRPTQNIIPLMLRHRFFTGLKLLIRHLVVIARTVPKSYISFIFGQHLIARVLLIVAVIVVPPVLLASHHIATPEIPPLIKVLEWIALVGLDYAAIQLLAYAQLKEPDSLASFARDRFAENKDYRLITFGHTHSSDQFEARGRWFYNTGTWIPIVETTAANISGDRTFIFLHLKHDPFGKLQPGVLQRWDDIAGRSEPAVLIRGAETETLN